MLSIFRHRHNYLVKSAISLSSSASLSSLLLSNLRYHNTSSESTVTGDHPEQEEHHLQEEEQNQQIIVASGNCVARHFRPTPENINLDELSEFLLQKMQNNSNDDVKKKNSSSSSSWVKSVSNLRRIMPPNAKAAAAVSTSSSAVGSGSQSSLLHRQKQLVNKNKNIKDLHSVDNLLLMRIELADDSQILQEDQDDYNNSNSNAFPSDVISPTSLRERDVVVFPDSTIVAWGSGCEEDDCERIAEFLFNNNNNNNGSSNNTNNAAENLNSSDDGAEHVETESIQYQLVTSRDELNEEIEQAVNAAAANTSKNPFSLAENDHQQDDSKLNSVNENDQSSSSASSSSSSSSLEVKDGVAILHGPFSHFSHYNCYPASLVVNTTKQNKTTSRNNQQQARGAEQENDDDDESGITNLALEMLPVVMAVAQSARVDAIDNYIVSKLAKDVRLWQRELAFKGTLSQRFTLRDLRKSKAGLLGVREEVSFALELEATSKLLRFSNELQRFREAYDEVADHFELEQRLEALESRVEAIDESLKYLHEERHSVLSEQMTVLIVVLIAMEIAVAVYELKSEKH